MVALPVHTGEVSQSGARGESAGSARGEERRGGEDARQLRGAEEEIRGAEPGDPEPGAGPGSGGGCRRAPCAAVRHRRGADRDRAGADVAVLPFEEEAVSGGWADGGRGGGNDIGGRGSVGPKGRGG